MEELIPVRRGLTTVTLWSEIFDLKTPVKPVARRCDKWSHHNPRYFYPSSREIRIPFDLRYNNKIS